MKRFAAALRSALIAAEWELCGEAIHTQEGLEKVQLLQPDLIFLDLGMPVMNGLDAAREIIRMEEGAQGKNLGLYNA